MIRNLLFIIILLFFPLSSWGATLFLMPQSQKVWQGETFIVNVWLDTEGEAINSVEGYLNFPQDRLEALEISEGGSILSLWLQAPSFSNETGLIGFAGGVPNGFFGQGRLFSITFGAVQGAEGSVLADINFGEDSLVFLHDGQGTPAFLNLEEGNYWLSPKPENLPVIFSSSHPDQNKWGQKNDFYLRWNLTEGSQYSYLLSQDPQAIPDEIPDKPEGELIWQGDMVYKGLADGIYYFHLRERRETGATSTLKCGPAATYRIMIDKTPPESFQLEIASIEGKNYLVFNTSDITSGIDYYEIMEGESDWERVKSPYFLKDQKLSGKTSVRAFDEAGNERLAELASIAPAAKKQPFPYLGIVLVLAVVGAILLLRRKPWKTNLT